MPKTSVNGWPVLETNRTTGPLPRLRKWVLPGTNRHVYLRDGSAGFLLAHFALWWNDHVSPLDGGVWDEWGWAVRPVRGQTSGFSNHASGTAVDLDATEFPRGIRVEDRMSTAQIKAIRDQLREYDGALFWGGDWKSVPDGMHIEITNGTTLAQAEAVATRLLIVDTNYARRITEANPGSWDVIVDGTHLDPDNQPPTPPPPPPAPAGGREVVHGHSSSRFDRSAGSLRRTAKWMARFADVDTWTEVGGRGEALRAEGRELFHVPGPGIGECAVRWDPARWEPLELVAAPLTTRPASRKRKAPVHAATAVLRHKATGTVVVWSVAHLSAAVEGRTGWRGITPRVLAHFSAVRGWRAHIAELRGKHPGARVVVCGDWNVNLKRPWVRVWARATWPELRQTGYLRGPGTHGKRLIDFTLTDLRLADPKQRAQVTPLRASSDHRPYIERLRLPKPTTPTTPTPTTDEES